MCFIAFLFVFVFFAAADGGPANSRIIGGNTAKLGQFPYLISMQINGEHMCGGTIINNRWVVLAAHCAAGYKNHELKIIAGITNLNEDGDLYKVEKIVVHETYDPLNIDNDIALLKTNRKIQFNDNIKSVALNNKYIGNDVPLTVCGWGSTKLWGPLPDNLQYLDVYSISQEECIEKQRPFLVSKGMLCTFKQSGQGTCHGDSGSGLVDKNKNVLVGIVSWGRPCAVGFPDVFTRISEYVDWINKAINN